MATPPDNSATVDAADAQSHRRLIVLGSTGSIGCNTLKVAEHLEDINIVALAAGRNMEVFANQIVEFKPELASCADDECANRLLELLHAKGAVDTPKIVIGEEGLVEIATHEEAEIVVSATVGAIDHAAFSGIQNYEITDFERFISKDHNTAKEILNSILITF